MRTTLKDRSLSWEKAAQAAVSELGAGGNGVRYPGCLAPAVAIKKLTNEHRLEELEAAAAELERFLGSVHWQRARRLLRASRCRLVLAVNENTHDGFVISYFLSAALESDYLYQMIEPQDSEDRDPSYPTRTRLLAMTPLEFVAAVAAYHLVVEVDGVVPLVYEELDRLASTFRR